MAERSFLSDILQRVARAGWSRLAQGNADDTDLVTLCTGLLGDQSEASGLVTALQVLDRFEAFASDEKLAFFQGIVAHFGVDDVAVERAISNWSPGNDAAARKLHHAAEPKSQELIRRLNRVPGATARLVKMRAALLLHQQETHGLKGLDEDFQHLFSSWFNRGFLEIRRVDWSTSAEILEKIITYEAVHEITGWDDLRQRVAADDRRLFAFFHPAMPKDPLIFVEVALMQDTPDAIAPIINARPKTQCRELDPGDATTAVFYSISNCQKGLRGISFGNFLIKQVVAELQHELPGLETFVTLSPVPGLRRWLLKATENTDPLLGDGELAGINALETGQQPAPEFATKIAAKYLTGARRDEGTAFDPVAHFHLGNGAILHKIHARADLSERGLESSWGVMVNYLYDGAQVELNHQAYTTERIIAVAPEIRALAGLKGKRGHQNV